LAQTDRRSIDFTVRALHIALRETIACFPVYRSYVRPGHISEQDTRYIEKAIAAAMARNAPQYAAVFDFLRDTLLLRYPRNATDEIRAAQNAFVLKFQQLTSPTTAKGIEDTSFYIYNRLTSLNEVGGNPGKFSVSPDELHRYFEDRQKHWPLGLSPLTTHDTKRSEDVRARISVLSEIPAKWRSAVESWFDLNEPLRRQLRTGIAPAPNDEYLLYQTLIGAWPFGESSPEEHADFVKRISAYMLKAMREAKVRTNWTHPDAEYEKAVDNFVYALLDRQKSDKFFATFLPLAKHISDIGVVNSLSQTLIRLTAPGVPDTYQGSELWDMSLVDPDNRRQVDYARRRSALADLKAQWDSGDRVELLRKLWSTRQDARLKLLLIWRLHEERRTRPDLFTAGEYVPLRPPGSAADRVFCFLRRHGSDALLVIATRHTAALGSFPWDTDPLAKTLLPALPAVPFRDLVTGLPYDPAAALRNFPVAVLGSWK
jgi:(1->4)-alpha-D-glucan 1-alpha-D-glucosylmutase